LKFEILHLVIVFAQAHLELGNFEEAISDFRMVLQVNPKNKVAEEKIEVATQKLEELRQKEKSICSQMFNKVLRVSCMFCRKLLVICVILFPALSKTQACMLMEAITV
jgi:regulator of replication initiation timing